MFGFLSVGALLPSAIVAARLGFLTPPLPALGSSSLMDLPKPLLESLLTDGKRIAAGYGPNHGGLSLAGAGLNHRDILLSRPESIDLEPAFYLTKIKHNLDGAHNSGPYFLLCVRGSRSTADLATIADSELIEICCGSHGVAWVHRGMYSAALNILDHVLPSILTHAATSSHSIHLRIVGHSMGASVGALCSLLLTGIVNTGLTPTLTRQINILKDISNISSVCFGAVACVSSARPWAATNLQSVVLGHDPLPCFSSGHLYLLRSGLESIQDSLTIEQTAELVTQGLSAKTGSDLQLRSPYYQHLFESGVAEALTQMKDAATSNKGTVPRTLLYPPGNCWHIIRSNDDFVKPLYIDDIPSFYSKFYVSKNSLSDHKILSYLKALRRLLFDLQY